MALVHSIGRPKDGHKRAAMVAAAEALFFEHGFAATSIEAVAERAGVSKVTVYGHFVDKAGLFEAVVSGVGNRMEAAMAAQIRASHSLADTLVIFGTILMTELMGPQIITFEKHLAGELSQNPSLGKRFFEAGPARTRAHLIKIIDDAAKLGEVIVDDPVLAAADLLSLWDSFASAEVRFGIIPPPDALEIKKRVERSVRLFLKAHA
jgi:TetR/AcrR family transcriptional regulator, mexJK operon transcriptional repressor